MATTTTNYELTKAGYNDIPDIETINDNMDTLDSSLVVGESNDDALATITKTTGWTNAEPVTLGDKFQSAMTKISIMIKNLKWIYKFIGSTDISSIGDGTITNAISTLSSNKLNASDVKTSLTDTSTAHALSTASGKALNDAIASVNDAVTPLVNVVNSVVAWDGTGGAARNNYAVRRGNVVSISYNVYNISLPANGQYWHVASALAPSATRIISGFVINSSGGALIPATYIIGTDGKISIALSTSITASQFMLCGTYVI